jgi:restriction system protein
MGYTATVTRASGDHGVDVIAHPDPLGLQTPFIKVQAKSGTSSIGEPQVNQLKGSLNAGEHGIVVSLGTFTRARTQSRAPRRT